MLLYWGMFTIGFTIGAIFSFAIFAGKDTESEYAESAKAFPTPDKLELPEVSTV